MATSENRAALSEKKTTEKAAPPRSVGDYIAAARPDQREALTKLRKTIKAAAPEASEAISYDIVGFKYKGKRLIYYGYWKQHLALYGFGSRFIQDHAKELARYDLRNGTLRFSADKPLPTALITKIVKARRAEIDKFP